MLVSMEWTLVNGYPVLTEVEEGLGQEELGL